MTDLPSPNFILFLLGTKMLSKVLTLMSVVILIKVLVVEMHNVLYIEEGIQLDIKFSEMKLEF
jgi:hypothetical protein